MRIVGESGESMGVMSHKCGERYAQNLQQYQKFSFWEELLCLIAAEMSHLYGQVHPENFQNAFMPPGAHETLSHGIRAIFWAENQPVFSGGKSQFPKSSHQFST